MGERPSEENVEKRFLKYTFFKACPDWRRIGTADKREAKSQFAAALRRHADVRTDCASLVGIRGDTDFLVIADAKELESFQSLLSDLMATKLGRYLEIPYSYLAMTRKSSYLGTHRHPGQEGSGVRSEPSSKYIFIYPFIKKREWYRLPFAQRQKMMADHFRVGHKYPGIKINTGYSFGLDDQEFVLAFEGDDASEFLALVEELRSSDVSMYTELETPIFTCVRAKIERVLELLG